MVLPESDPGRPAGAHDSPEARDAGHPVRHHREHRPELAAAVGGGGVAREARQTLATYFSTMVPAPLQPSAQELDVYQDAARLPERERRSQLTVAGRRVPDYPGGNTVSASPSRPAGWEWLRSLVGITAGWIRRSKPRCSPCSATGS